MKTCFQPAAELSDVGPVALVSEQAQLFADKGTEPLWEEDLESQSHAAARKKTKKEREKWATILPICPRPGSHTSRAD